MNNNNIVVNFGSISTQTIPILNLKLSSNSNYTHKIILTVRFSCTEYILQNSTIEPRRQIGRPKYIPRPRIVNFLTYEQRKSQTNISDFDIN